MVFAVDSLPSVASVYVVTNASAAAVANGTLCRALQRNAFACFLAPSTSRATGATPAPPSAAAVAEAAAAGALRDARARVGDCGAYVIAVAVLAALLGLCCIAAAVARFCCCCPAVLGVRVVPKRAHAGTQTPAVARAPEFTKQLALPPPPQVAAAPAAADETAIVVVATGSSGVGATRSRVLPFRPQFVETDEEFEEKWTHVKPLAHYNV